MRLLGKIIVPAGKDSNNRVQILDLATKTTNSTTVVQTAPDSAGWLLAYVADGGGALTVNVNAGTKTLTVHFRDGISTNALVEAAIAAAMGGHIQIRTPATNQAQALANTVDEFAAAALAGPLFAIEPVSYRKVAFNCDLDGPTWRHGVGDALVATVDDAPLYKSNQSDSLQGTYALPLLGMTLSIAVHNPGGATATVRVYGE